MSHLEDAISHVRQVTKETKSDTAIVLGTGLGQLTNDVRVIYDIPYSSIPYFPESTVESHEGKLIFGEIAGKHVWIMSGRFHYYEGYEMSEVTFPVRVLISLGVKNMIFTNAVGSVVDEIDAGDLVSISDHINLHASNPLRGQDYKAFGPRFPDMSEAYCKRLRNIANNVAQIENITLKTGVYVGTQGPNLETPAEYRFFNIIGGSVVGMSTVPEVIVCNHMGVSPLVISVATNKCYPFDELASTTIEEVIEVAEGASDNLINLIKGILIKLNE